MRNVSIIGLGKLGSCMAATMAQKGMNVVGVEVNAEFARAINEGRAPVPEARLQDLIAANRGRLRATDACEQSIVETEITFVIVPTPSDDRGAFVLRYVKPVMEQIGRGLAQKSTYHLVVLTSTVLPGACDYGVVPILEKASGKKVGQDFGFCYNPEFIAIGTVIRDLLNPDFVLIGESDERAGKMLQDWYASYLDKDAPVSRMNFVNAELTKIALNTFVTTKISFANMLLGICERLPGGDIDVVTKALGQDTRIGSRCLMGGLGYGGPCFPRDNRALAFTAQQIGAPAPLAEATDRMNREVLEWAARRVTLAVPRGGKVSVLGLAYKPDTVLLEESHGAMLARALANAGRAVTVHDPLALEAAKREFGTHVSYAETPRDATHNADAVVVALPSPQYRSLKAEDVAAAGRPVLVYDCWRQLSPDLQRHASIRYHAFGAGNSSEDTPEILSALWKVT